MLHDKIELIRDGRPQALLTWHKPDGQGGFIPIAMEFSDELDADSRQRVTDVCGRAMNLMDHGESSKAFPGSSKHFLALPKVLARLGYRIRTF